MLSLHDFERAAEATLKPKSWAYYYSGADDGQTFKQNHAIWDEVKLRPRVLRDVSGELDLRTSIVGCESRLPFMISPAAMGKLAHSDGEICLVKGAAQAGIHYCPSNHASVAHRDMAAAAVSSQALFFQLYMHRDRGRSESQLAEAKQLGFKAVVVTVDTPFPGKRELDLRTGLDETSIELTNPGQKVGDRVSAIAQTSATIDASLSWSDFAWLKKASQGLPIIVKGIHTVEDALLAVEHGASGLMLSNHGGRQVNTASTPLETLLELRLHAPHLLDGAPSRPTILVDGGIRRGTDVVKALCLGATAVSLARPFMYSLVYGAEGVARAASVLEDEVARAMRLLGATSVRELGPEFVNARKVERRVWRGAGSKL
ncbi:SPOSA6832_04289 [Sporobolomyces salmonicolor]|uniref:SPOSA6832_04289-mRNA-1:cds n=1 Tax=Sporidiobolus salmonicolor TaxID=5005 RepID=A0A0D6ERA4_SPOSA|nr:SPOSA6832_04289 [Sporobolomyces salmonicolor]